MEKIKMKLYVILIVLAVILLGTSIYINLIAKSSEGLTYILIGQMFIGIVGCLTTLFMGLNVFIKKKNFELLFISFLEVLLTSGLVIFNYVKGFAKIVNRNNYIEYMEYVSMEFNIYIYLIFVGIIGLLTINLFIKERIISLNFSSKEIVTENAN